MPRFPFVERNQASGSLRPVPPLWVGDLFMPTAATGIRGETYRFNRSLLGLQKRAAFAGAKENTPVAEHVNPVLNQANSNCAHASFARSYPWTFLQACLRLSFCHRGRPVYFEFP